MTDNIDNIDNEAKKMLEEYEELIKEKARREHEDLKLRRDLSRIEAEAEALRFFNML